MLQRSSTNLFCIAGLIETDDSGVCGEKHEENNRRGLSTESWRAPRAEEIIRNIVF